MTRVVAHLLLAVALLLQGAATVAAPAVAATSSAAAPSSADMPCHHQDGKAAPACCHADLCDCDAACGAALPGAVFHVAAGAPAADVRAVDGRAAVHAAYALTPLRPPIARSA